MLRFAGTWVDTGESFCQGSTNLTGDRRFACSGRLPHFSSLAPEQHWAGSPRRPALVSSPQIPATVCMSSSPHPGAADEWPGRA